MTEHLEACLRTAIPDDDGEDDEVDVDGNDGFETYTWAGQTRVRATSLIEGGLRGAGFVSITQGNEDEELDIENDGDDYGSAQYGEEDAIPPEAEDETEERLRAAALPKQKAPTRRAVSEGNDDGDDEPVAGPSNVNGKHYDDPDSLRRENRLLRQQLPLCNVCMDAFTKPVVSVACWHVHCEQCWLRALGAKKLCPQCKVIVRARDLRRIYL